MKASQIIGLGLVTLAVMVPSAAADSTDTSVDTSSTATPPATTTTVPPATTTTVPPVTTTTTPPTTTTTTVPPTTTTTTTDVPSTTTTTTTDGDGTGTDLIPEDVMVDTVDGCAAANCIPAAAGAGGVPITGAGGRLPFTGIGDVIAPILLSLVVLLAGIVAIRWAQLREAVARTTSRRIIGGSGVTTRTGYSSALREQQITARARRFYEPRVA